MSAIQRAGLRLSSGVVECVLHKVRSDRFDAPGPNGSTIQIPVSFLQHPAHPHAHRAP